MRTEEASAASEVSRARRAALVLPLATLAVAVGLGTVLAWKVTGSITHPVEQLAAASKRIAAGDFSEPVLVSSEDELGQLATTFNDMARQLQRHYDDLEERVAERTRALQASAEVARRLATILDRHELARAVVNQVQQAFGYYHVQIYLYDTRRESLLLIAGTGEAGQIMQLSGHRIGLGTGLVGRAAERNEVTLVPDVSLTRDWLPNPLLPETKAELAVPIAYAGGVVGVLDVQADVVSGVTSDDAELVLSIARQVAIALENARLVEEAEQRADRAALVNRISQRIQRARSVDSVLRVAAVELAEALDVHKAAIEIHAPSSRNNDRKLRSKKGGNGDGQ
jgi:nitrate/nitrite-specific signal transduction histidine kinase